MSSRLRLSLSFLFLMACGDDSVAPGGAGPVGGQGVGGSGAGPAAGGGGAGGNGGAGGQAGEPGPISLEVVASDLDQPIFVAADTTDPSRLYIAQKTGIVSLVKDDVVAATPFIDVSAIIEVPSAMQERGLLSIALAPDYATSGRFFLFYSDDAEDLVLGEFARSADPDVAEPDQVAELLRFPIVPGNHIAGAMAFGPDGLLYVSIGDGASAQDIGSKFGKILRVDVDTYPTPPPGNLTAKGADPDIFHVGFHNPWRITFDRETGDFFIADVGLMPPREEVNRVPSDLAASNFGFPLMSGFECVDEPCDPSLVLPKFAYEHDEGRCAIMGGVMYRGASLPWLDGEFVFADLCSAEILALKMPADLEPELDLLTPTWIDPVAIPDNLVGVFEDAAGELIVVSLDGEVVRLVPTPP
jgi:glucose/arabinose dehydrogenase